MTVDQGYITEAVTLLDMFSKKESRTILQDILKDVIDEPGRLSIKGELPDFRISAERFEQILKLGEGSREFAACGAMVGLVVSYARDYSLDEAREFVKSAHEAISKQISK